MISISNRQFGLVHATYELLGGPTRDRIRVYGQAENVENVEAARGSPPRATPR